MITPQLTEQYGQVLRVSLARGILSPWVWAWRGVRSNPRTESPAPPARVPFKKFLRENSITASAWREQGSTEFMVMAVAKAASLRCSNGENYTSWFSAPSMAFRGWVRGSVSEWPTSQNRVFHFPQSRLGWGMLCRGDPGPGRRLKSPDRKSTRLNSS